MSLEPSAIAALVATLSRRGAIRKLKREAGKTTGNPPRRLDRSLDICLAAPGWLGV